jgi:DNA-binding XRE family transcriptional regulator
MTTPRSTFGITAVGDMLDKATRELDRLKAAIREGNVRDIAIARLALAEKDTAEYIPAEVVERKLAGAHPVRAWREHRGMTLSALAAKAGLPHGYLSEIENRKKPGSVAALKALAEALGVTLDDIA